jgi:hypothetical protein
VDGQAELKKTEQQNNGNERQAAEEKSREGGR